MITDRINFRQPKYVLPAILYPLLLVTGYLVMDIFDTEVAETPSALQTTEFLNPELPEAQMRDDGIGGKYESMVKSYGRIQDYSAVENIERNNNETAKEDYDSRYTDEDLNGTTMKQQKKITIPATPMKTWPCSIRKQPQSWRNWNACVRCRNACGKVPREAKRWWRTPQGCNR